MDDIFSKKEMQQEKKCIHLDYASATPVRQEVLDVMLPYFSDIWANPSAVYRAGVEARIAIEHARTRLARILAIRASDIVFTSGGTESNNLALRGYIEALHNAGRAYDDMEVLTTALEHPSISEPLVALQSRGVRVAYMPICEDGHIDETSIEGMLHEQTVLVTITYANSEIGTVQDVKHLTRLVHAYNRKKNKAVRVHLDASQAPLWLPIDVTMLGVDLMTLDAGKCYGPKGVGVLAYRHTVVLAPQMFGGGQEHGIRSGTENTPLIMGCVEAIELAQAEWKSRSVVATTLRDFMVTTLQKEIPGVLFNGNMTERIANNVSISIPGIDTEFAVVTLDVAGIAASTKSACGAGNSEGSSVVFACTCDRDRANATLRFSFGLTTTKEEIIYVVQVLKAHVEKMRAFRQSLISSDV